MAAGLALVTRGGGARRRRAGAAPRPPQAGEPAPAHRRPHRPGQPPRARGGARAARARSRTAGRAGPTGPGGSAGPTRSRSCSSTSTASRRSTRPSATPPATGCSRPSAPGCATVLRPTQLLARLGGDEFAVVLPPRAPEQAIRVAQRAAGLAGRAVRGRGVAPARVGQHRHRHRPADGSASPTTCCGRPTSRCTRPRPPAPASSSTTRSATAPAASACARIEELRGALERGELEVHLQPQVDLSDGARHRRRGARALAAPGGRRPAAGLASCRSRSGPASCGRWPRSSSTARSRPARPGGHWVTRCRSA